MKPVSLKELLWAIEFSSDEGASFIEPATGSVLSLSLGHDDADLIARADAPDVIYLPDLDPGDEIDWMRGFARAQPDPQVCNALLDALEGRRPFRRFKDAAYRSGLLNAWYEVRDHERIALLRRWLDAEKIPFLDDVEPAAAPDASSVRASAPPSAPPAVPSRDDPAPSAPPRLRWLEGGRRRRRD